MTTQELNDQLRRNIFSPGRLGKVVLTAGVSGLPLIEQIILLKQVQRFDDFTEDNDPHGEHDFGKVDYKGERYFWKIDYYNSDLTGGSNNPADPSITCRILTIMRADEY
ncbi:MAG: DUF3768 domain-containing protein [Alphaproteobacteria bacterium]|nr:DUF3768 domain-containing protein [Alphaproteobacteria bacterium]